MFFFTKTFVGEEPMNDESVNLGNIEIQTEREGEVTSSLKIYYA